MRIVNRVQFLKMPEGTVFSKYKPCIISEIAIKGKTQGSDYLFQDISESIDFKDSGDFSQTLFDAEENGTPFNMDLDIQQRDGFFDEDQKFVVWEKEDVGLLISRLSRALEEGYRGTI